VLCGKEEEEEEGGRGEEGEMDGEESLGRLVSLIFHQGIFFSPLMTDNADNATITALVCTLQSEIISVSSSGQLKVWDSRKQGNKAVRVLAM